MENNEKKVLKEEQLKEANGGGFWEFGSTREIKDDDLDSVCGGAGKPMAKAIKENNLSWD